MKRLIALSLLLFACNRQEEAPKDLLPQQKMTAVLKQVLVADEWLALRAERDANTAVFDESVRLYRGVFKKEGITEEQFRTSLRWYQDHPQDLRVVLDSLNRNPSLTIQTKTDTGKNNLLQPLPGPARGRRFQRR